MRAGSVLTGGKGDVSHAVSRGFPGVDTKAKEWFCFNVSTNRCCAGPTALDGAGAARTIGKILPRSDREVLAAAPIPPTPVCQLIRKVWTGRPCRRTG